MVLLKQLFAVDSSLCVRSTERLTKEITTLCSLDHLREGGIVFIKNKRYWNRMVDILETADSIKDIGIIFQDSFYQANGVADHEATLSQCNFYATVESVDLAISRFSKIFYDTRKNEIDELVDGRKNDTACIHPDSYIADDVFIGHGVHIAEGVTIHSGCVILAHMRK